MKKMSGWVAAESTTFHWSYYHHNKINEMLKECIHFNKLKWPYNWPIATLFNNHLDTTYRLQAYLSGCTSATSSLKPPKATPPNLMKILSPWFFSNLKWGERTAWKMIVIFFSLCLPKYPSLFSLFFSSLSTWHFWVSSSFSSSWSWWSWLSCWSSWASSPLCCSDPWLFRAPCIFFRLPKKTNEPLFDN